MSVEELLKPRYKVIADYPNSPFDIGEILTIIKGNNYQSNLDSQIYTDRYPEMYPAIFQPLEWWEERDEKYMPEYVKVSYSDEAKSKYGDFNEKEGTLWKVEKWEKETFANVSGEQSLAYLIGYYPSYKIEGEKHGRMNACHLIPSTREEYEQFKSQQ